MRTNLSLLFLLFFCTKLFSQSLETEKLLDLIQAQRYGDAATYIRSVYPDSLPDNKVQERLAYCCYMSGNLPEAEKHYLQIFKRDSTNLKVLYNLAAISDRRSNLLQSLVYYKQILKKDSTNFLVYSRLATIADQRGEKDIFLEHIGKANALNPSDGNIAYDYASELKERKQLLLADSVLQIALNADTSNVLLMKGKLEIAYKLEKYNDCIIWGRKALQAGDNNLQTVNLLALSYYKLKQYQKCVDTYQLLEAFNLGNETTYYFTALSYRNLNKPEKSALYLSKSIDDAISDNTFLYYQELAHDFETLKKYPQSIEAFSKANEFKDKNIHNYSIARLYDGFLKDPKSALRYYKLYVKNFKEEKSEKALYTYSLGRIKFLNALL